MSKWIVRFLYLLLSLPVCYLILVLILSSVPVNPAETDPIPEDRVLMYVRSNGAHTDLVVPVRNAIRDWQELIDFDEYREGNYRYIAFGWGDKGFYLNTPTWADLKMSTAVNALSGRGGTALHVTLYSGMVESDRTRAVWLTSEQYHNLSAHIEEAFYRSETGDPVRIDAVTYTSGYDHFYEASGTYSCFYTCNSWTNEGLKKAGVRTALWAPVEWSVMRYR